jgi:hypothetical protein
LFVFVEPVGVILQSLGAETHKLNEITGTEQSALRVEGYINAGIHKFSEK